MRLKKGNFFLNVHSCIKLLDSKKKQTRNEFKIPKQTVFGKKVLDEITPAVLQQYIETRIYIVPDRHPLTFRMCCKNRQ